MGVFASSGETRFDVQATARDGGRYDSMDGGGRAASGTAAESNAGSTTTGK